MLNIEKVGDEEENDKTMKMNTGCNGTSSNGNYCCCFCCNSPI